MAKITAFTNLTIDGVYQAPGRSDEDTRGGFTHGGWAAPYQAMAEAGDKLGAPGELLFGRWTYELFFASWAHQTGNPFSDFFNATRKHVVTRQTDYIAPWTNTNVISGDFGQAVKELKRLGEKDLLVFGSGELVSHLADLDLVDRYVLLIHPIILGSGKSFLSGLLVPQKLVLEDVKTTTKGVIVATYSRPVLDR